MASCSSLNEIVDPVEKCKFAVEYCQSNSIIPFGDIVFCQLSSTIYRVVILLIGVVWVFGAIGVAAFDYLSPNLTYIAEISGLSESLMGVTVLAFGNGSVDVFGAFVALRVNEGGMAFGEIAGGALFVVSVVIGSMAIVKPFVVDRSLFMRDAAFLAASTVFSMVVVYDGVITVYEGLGGLVLYSVYAAFVVHQHLGTQKQVVLAEEDIESQTSTASEHGHAQINDGEWHPRSVSPSPASALSPSPDPDSFILPIIRPSLVSSFELSRRVHKYLHGAADLRLPSPLPADISALGGSGGSGGSNEPNVQRTSDQGPNKHMRRRSSAPDLMYPLIGSPFEVYNNNLLPVMPNITTSDSEIQILKPGSSTVPELRVSTHMVPEHLAPKRTEGSGPKKSHLQLLPPLQIPQTNPDIHSSFGQHLLPFRSFETEHVDLFNDSQRHSPLLMKDMVDRLIENQKMLTPTVTAVSERAEDDRENIILEDSVSLNFPPEISRWWVCMLPFLDGWQEQGWLQRLGDTIMLPFTTALAWSIPSYANSSSHLYLCMYSIGVPLSLPIVVSGLDFSSTLFAIQLLIMALGLIVWGYFKKSGPSPLLVATVGLIMALFWVMFLATELVTILTLLGVVSHISSTIMGLTVFALGDSLGDFVANITIAQIGYSAMAVAACFGGPIFTLLVGISGVSLITMLSDRHSQLRIPISRGLLINTCGLLFVLAFLTYRVKRDNFVVTTTTGICLIGIWLVVILSTIIWK